MASAAACNSHLVAINVQVYYSLIVKIRHAICNTAGYEQHPACILAIADFADTKKNCFGLALKC
jgi:hypothetical protein